MSSEMGERRPVKLTDGQSHPSEPENLQCPRCESTNTKFCYYNNYNLSQPRYFCKGCRRYWTRGGSLRNIPVGGGSRKNSKRSRSGSSSCATSAPNTPPLPAIPCNSVAPTEPPVSFSVKTEATTTPTTMSPYRCMDVNLNEALPGSFSSLLGAQQVSGGFLGLGGYGIGLGPGVSSGFEMLGFGFGKGAGEWPAMVENVNGGVGVGGSSGGSSSGCNTWQMETVEDGGGLTDGGDCFAWPDLAISTPGTTTAGLD